MITYETGKVSKKGLVVIPVEVRKRLNIEEGDKLEFVLEAQEARMKVIKKKSVLDVFGVVKTEKPYVPVSQIREQVMNQVVAEQMSQYDE